ncbi:N-carbamoyl-L-amino acid hydrolase [Peptococcaceae bacterium CEB3]|nr:N-carbamoyl-L-amino acid hydrolase [Peptococcaceae bacterium CEB3]
MVVSRIGRTSEGGMTRLSFTQEEKAALELLRTYMEEAGLTVRSDAVGNLIGRREGLNTLAPVVLIGSHIDSVYNGGNFDGPLGVLSALEVLQTMEEQTIRTENPIEVVVLRDEEGARFSFGMVGSRAMAGTLTQEDLEHKDDGGLSIAQAMGQAGLDPAAISKARRPKESIKAYVEVHIEQGKVLEKKNLPVGIVSGMFGIVWLKFSLEGEAGHAGATPMNMRKDALVAAARIIQMIEREASRTETTVGTVGQVQVFPGGINIIPGRVEFTLDLRATEAVVLQRVEEAIRCQTELICKERAIQCQLEILQRIRPAACSEHVQAVIRKAFRKRGLTEFTLVSGAGHDGMQFAHLWPIGMVFVRSEDGISHNPAEWSSPKDCAEGANVLYETVLDLAGFRRSAQPRRQPEQPSI